MDILTTIKQCTLIVTALLGSANPPTSDSMFEERVMVCSIVHDEATRQEVPVDVALAVTWRESNMTYAKTNSSGCSGPMQIKIKYWCPNKEGKWSPTRADGVIDNCDMYERGVFTLKYYLNRFRTVESALCAYGWGNCDNEGRTKYVKRTLRHRAIIKNIIDDFEDYRLIP